MEAIKRKFLTASDRLIFNSSNDFETERYYKAFTNYEFADDTICLMFDHSFWCIADSLTVTVTYFDLAKKIEKFQAVEFVTVFDLPLPKVGINKRNECSIPIKIKVGTKVLWKVKFKIKPHIESEIAISLA